MSSSPTERLALPHYAQPPVVEVVMGVTFAPFVPAWCAPHLGTYWAAIRNDFPRCEHVPPLGDSPPAAAGWPLPLPRTWFISSDESLLLQVQNGRFLLNWRQRDGRPYPRYHQVKAEFERRLVGFRQFAATEKLGELSLQGCELTYMNQMPYTGFMASAAEFGELFRDASWQSPAERRLPPPRQAAFSLRFDLPADLGTLDFDMKHARRQADQQPLYLAELTVRRASPVTGEELAGWFDTAHEWIVRGFADLTTRRAQDELWKRADA